MHILGILHGISLQVYPQTTFLVHQMYINIHSYQHKITQLTWIYLVHTFIIYTFDTMYSWILFRLSDNWWFLQQIDFLNESCHTLTSSVSMVFQNIFHIMGSILHICCPTSQKLYVLNWFVEMIQWNPIGVAFIYACNHLLINILES